MKSECLERNLFLWTQVADPQKEKLHLKLGRKRLWVSVGGTGFGTFFITVLNEKYIKINLEFKKNTHTQTCKRKLKTFKLKIIKFPSSNKVLLERALQISLGSSSCQRHTIFSHY